MEKKTTTIIIVAIAVVAIWFLFFRGPPPLTVDGYYDPVTGQCMPPRTGEVEFFACCMNADMEQVACATGLPLQAIYGGTSGIFYVFHVVSVTANAAEQNIEEVYIETVTWTPANAVLSAAYTPITGIAYGRALPAGQTTYWSTSAIDLSTVGTYSGIVTVDVRGTRVGAADATGQGSATITIDQETIGFTVTVDKGI